MNLVRQDELGARGQGREQRDDDAERPEAPLAAAHDGAQAEGGGGGPTV